MKRHREIEPAYHEAGHAVMEILGCHYKRTLNGGIYAVMLVRARRVREPSC